MTRTEAEKLGEWLGEKMAFYGLRFFANFCLVYGAYLIPVRGTAWIAEGVWLISMFILSAIKRLR